MKSVKLMLLLALLIIIIPSTSFAQVDNGSELRVITKEPTQEVLEKAKIDFDTYVNIINLDREGSGVYSNSDNFKLGKAIYLFDDDDTFAFPLMQDDEVVGLLSIGVDKNGDLYSNYGRTNTSDWLNNPVFSQNDIISFQRYSGNDYVTNGKEVLLLDKMNYDEEIMTDGENASISLNNDITRSRSLDEDIKIIGISEIKKEIYSFDGEYDNIPEMKREYPTTEQLKKFKTLLEMAKHCLWKLLLPIITLP